MEGPQPICGDTCNAGLIRILIDTSQLGPERGMLCSMFQAEWSAEVLPAWRDHPHHVADNVQSCSASILKHRTGAEAKQISRSQEVTMSSAGNPGERHLCAPRGVQLAPVRWRHAEAAL